MQLNKYLMMTYSVQFHDYYIILNTTLPYHISLNILLKFSNILILHIYIGKLAVVLYIYIPEKCKKKKRINVKLYI